MSSANVGVSMTLITVANSIVPLVVEFSLQYLRNVRTSPVTLISDGVNVQIPFSTV